MHTHTLLLATGNPGKLRELKARLEPVAPVRVIGLAELDPRPAEIPEDGDTFEANAILKAVGYGRLSGVPSLADDSGLVVDALDGAPGVYSARFAGEHANDSLNNQRLLSELSDIPEAERSARFRCVVALFIPSSYSASAALVDAAQAAGLATRSIPPLASGEGGGVIVLAQGQAEGRILFELDGVGGFGYDPLFFSEDLQCTFAQASAQAKLRVSHRGRALNAFDPLWASLASPAVPEISG